MRGKICKTSFYIEGVDDHELPVALTKLTCKEFPENKPKKRNTI